MIPSSNVRYLTAKRTVDDRALNKDVLDRLRVALEGRGALTVLEVGAGPGTMVARLVDWGVVHRADYRLVDVDGEALAAAGDSLGSWARARGYRSTTLADEPGGLQIRDGGGIEVTVRVTRAEIVPFLEAAAASGHAGADLLIANAFLDLVDVPALLPKLLARVAATGLFWFTINYDGETIFEPGHPDDEAIVRSYNRSMDERIRYGRPAGESRTGRHLFGHLAGAGAEILAAGSSDWVVHPGPSGYPDDEAYFLHHILHTIDEELQRRPEVDRQALAAWVALRHAQVEAGELVYLAHQLDFMGRPRRRD